MVNEQTELDIIAYELFNRLEQVLESWELGLKPEEDHSTYKEAINALGKFTTFTNDAAFELRNLHEMNQKLTEEKEAVKKDLDLLMLGVNLVLESCTKARQKNDAIFYKQSLEELGKLASSINHA